MYDVKNNKNLKGYYKPKKKVDKRVIKIKTLKPDEDAATEKQIGYICGLLNENKLRGFFHKERDGKRLSKKQASNLIDCLKEGTPFKFNDVDSMMQQYSKNL